VAAVTTEESVEATPTENQSVRGLLVVYCKGLAMGAADTVPGVSGGTIALIVGVYERLIAALTALDPAVLSHLPGLHRRETQRALVADLRAMDVPFLMALGGGMATAVILLARVVEFALASMPGQTFAFFFGLIGASAIVLAEPAWFDDGRQILAALVGFAIAFTIAGVSGGLSGSTALPLVFVAGALAISGMLLPGISGAFILLLLGQYETMTTTLNRFVDGLVAAVSEGTTAQLVDDALLIGVFLSGAAVGVFTVAYAVQWALANYRRATLAFLVSLMVGSLRLPVIEVLAATDATPTDLASVAVAAVVGAGLVLALDWSTADLEY
jgi:putative membrane protein